MSIIEVFGLTAYFLDCYAIADQHAARELKMASSKDVTEIPAKQLSREPSEASSGSPPSELFDGTTRLMADGGCTILIPNPSADPRDPLNLPMWRKVLITAILTLYSVSGMCIINALSAMIVYISPDYIKAGITAGQISDLFTYPSLFVGLGNLVSMPAVAALGRRPVMLASTILLFVASVVCATNQNYHWHLGGRMLASFAAAQCQALVLLIIQDIFFLHQRARALQAYSSAEVVFNAGLIISCSYLAAAHGWRAWYWLFAAISGLAAILTFLFVPETIFQRPISAFMGVDAAAAQASETIIQVLADPEAPPPPPAPSSTMAKPTRQPLTTADNIEDHIDRINYPDRSFTSDLRIFTVKPRLRPYLICLKEIFQVMLFPHVLWVSVTNGLYQGMDVSIGMLYGSALVGPPYKWSKTAVSLVQIGMIGIGLIAIPLIGAATDAWIRAVAARRRGGKHEPEERLVGYLLPFIGAPILTAVYGYAIQEPGRFHWMAIVGPFVFFLLLLLGASTGGTTYLIDAHPRRANAILVAIPVVRGLVSFGLSKRTVDYIANIGAVHTFGIYSGISGFITLTGMLLWWKGKKCREFCARWAV